MQMRWKIAWVVSLALLLFTGCVGIYNAYADWGEGLTPLQRSVTVSVFLYGVFGLVTAYGLMRRQAWSVRTALVWMIAVTYAPGVAVMAYGGQDAILSSAIAASAGSAAIALGVLWTARATTLDRSRTVSET